MVLGNLGFPGTRSGDVSALLALEQRKAESEGNDGDDGG